MKVSYWSFPNFWRNITTAIATYYSCRLEASKTLEIKTGIFLFDEILL